MVLLYNDNLYSNKKIIIICNNVILFVYILVCVYWERYIKKYIISF